MADEVRYIPNGNNRVLKHILRLVWEKQCYWCRRFKDYSELEIDHIFPQKASSDERKRIRAAFDLQDDYDIHALGNLAPICGECNKSKQNEDLTELPVVKSALKKAQKLAPTVASRVRSFRASTELGGALLLAAEVELDDDEQRTTFAEGAPAVVQRLAELGEIEADFYVHRTVAVEIQDQEHTLDLRLNEQGRTAVTVLENVAGGRLADALVRPLADLFHQAEEAVAQALLDHDDGMGAPDVGSVSIDWPTVVIDTIVLNASPPAALEIEFGGAFEALASGAVARDAPQGDGLEYVQGDVSFTCRFKFDLTWDPRHPVGEFYFDQTWLENFDADTMIDGTRTVVWDDLFDRHESIAGVRTDSQDEEVGTGGSAVGRESDQDVEW